MPTVGYSGTPLFKKLGIKSNQKVFAKDPPENYLDLLAGMPEDLYLKKRVGEDMDLIHIFSENRADLEKALVKYRSKIREDGMIWVSWYKKASKIPTDITEDSVREIAFKLGLVDIKVCAVDEKWSGLKLVIRRENRKK